MTDMWERYFDALQQLYKSNKIESFFGAALDPFDLKEAWGRILTAYPVIVYRLLVSNCDVVQNLIKEERLLKEKSSCLDSLKSVHQFCADFERFNYTQWFNFFSLVVNEAANIKVIDKKECSRAQFAIKFYRDAFEAISISSASPKIVDEFLGSNGENFINIISNITKFFVSGNIDLYPKGEFKVGKDFANTKGSIVYRNDVMEIIHYSSQTKKQFEYPLLIMPPCINKYYILDLGKKKSFVRWLLREGFDVFIISWANLSRPDVEFEDYILKGGLRAIEFINDAYGKSKVNIVGYCIGGTMLSMLLAYLKNIKKDNLVNSATFLTSTMDFGEIGDIAAFLTDNQLERYFAIAKGKGYVAGKDMFMFFNLLRARELIWSFIVDRYLLGKSGKLLDFLFWHSDSTNLPYNMFYYYMNNMYRNNLLIVPNALSVNEVPIDISNIDCDSYFVACENDHLVLWQAAYRSAQYIGGKKRFILSSSGHIAGIINHPDFHKYSFKSSNSVCCSPSVWAAKSKKTDESWWPDWSRWLKKRSGEMISCKRSENIDIKIKKYNAPGKNILYRC